MASSLLSTEGIERIKRNNNFDFIRYLLAVSIIISHFSVLTSDPVYWPIPGAVRVKGFFILSGFLVFFSYIRNSDPATYFSRRFYRLMPGYVMVILLSVLAGCILTSLPIEQFLTGRETLRYLFSNLLTLNFLQPGLPGVFDGNPSASVNGSLWTIKVEIMLYFTVPLVYLACRKWNKAWILPAVYLMSVFYTEVLAFYYQKTGNPLFEIMNRQLFGQIKYFYGGTLILCYFTLFCRHIRWLFPVAGVICYLGVDSLLLRMFEPLALATLLIGFAYFFKPLNFMQRYDNISYGMYLYHYPVIQTLIAIGLYDYSKWVCLGASFAVTILLSFLSWRFIEKRFLFRDKKPVPVPVVADK